MRSAKQLLALLICVLLCLPAVPAQDAQPSSAKASTDVTIVIQQEQVRFTAQRAIAALRLQVFEQAGELIYDSGLIPALEINWPLQDGNGQALKSGLYAYALSIKELSKEAGNEPGQPTTRVRRGHFIIDRAQDRDGTDKLWVTSQNDSGVGAALTVAKDETATIAGAVINNDRTLKQRREIQERTAHDRETANETAKPNDTSNLAASVIGQIAKFTGTNNQLGDSIITEANGNIGIATTTPANRLDVNGGIRAFFNSSTGMVAQTTGGTNAWARFHMNTPGQRWFIGTSNNFNGNQFYLWDDTFDQARLTIQPNGGEVAFPSPVSNHLVVQTSGGTNSWAQLRMKTTNQIWGLGTSQNFNGEQFYLFDGTHNQSRLTIQPNGGAIALPRGNVGIGTTNPTTKLHVEGTGIVETAIRSGNERAILSLGNGLGPSNYVWTLESGVGGNFPSLFGIYNRTVNKSGLEIDGNLLVTVKALQITGGADFAENFDVQGASVNEIQPGMVVAIDPRNPGKLNLSRRAYDRRVAGIISGAGNVKPGMMMRQEGTLADGKHPVALTGRVYVWVDAARGGAIKPGDLLTTSATPGHAMKAINSVKAQGAIIGKAMTALKQGKGLVLVLVTLQ